MSGGNGWAPGEWTDDTAMAVAILETFKRFGTLGSRPSFHHLLSLWYEWAQTARDVGVQTSNVLNRLAVYTETEAFKVAEDFHNEQGRSAGNGSLMRTAPIALINGSDTEVADLARKVSSLTHFEEDAGDACVIWTLAIRYAVRTGKLDIVDAAYWLPEHRRMLWLDRILVAKESQPQDFPNNGWVVSAFQAALSAVYIGLDDPVAGLEAAVRCGNDTDTVAAIAGSLLGAIHGSDAFPEKWTSALNGWPGIGKNGLTELAGWVLASSTRFGQN